jgi:hypothetical protein
MPNQLPSQSGHQGGDLKGAQTKGESARGEEAGYRSDPGDGDGCFAS